MIKHVFLFLFILTFNKLNAQEINIGNTVYSYSFSHQENEGFNYTQKPSKYSFFVDFLFKKQNHRLEIIQNKYTEYTYQEQFNLMNYKRNNYNSIRYIYQNNIFKKNQFSLFLGAFIGYGYQNKKEYYWIYESDNAGNFLETDNFEKVDELPKLIELDLGIRVNFNFQFFERIKLGISFNTTLKNTRQKGTVKHTDYSNNNVDLYDYKDNRWDTLILKPSLSLSYILYSQQRIKNNKLK